MVLAPMESSWLSLIHGLVAQSVPCSLALTVNALIRQKQFLLLVDLVLKIAAYFWTMVAISNAANTTTFGMISQLVAPVQIFCLWGTMVLAQVIVKLMTSQLE